MSKIHLIISADPVPDGQTLNAICGVSVSNAKAVPLGEMEEPASCILFCKDCFGRNYFYAITTAQQAKDLEVA
jgi:hypothetical protein